MSAVAYRVRSLLRSRRRSVFATAAAVAVVSALILVLAAGAVRTLRAPDRYVRANDEGYDITLEQFNGPPRTAEVAALPAVDSVRTATFVFGGLIPEGSDQPSDALVFAGDSRAFGLHVVDGREPDPARRDEFVATRGFAKATGAHLGDRFTLLTFSPATAEASGFDGQPDGPTLQATLVAAARSAGPTAPPSPEPLPDGLTPREAEILGLIARGLTNPEIATALVLSTHTVKTHVNRIFAKTGSRDRAAALRYAQEHGFGGPG